jgi:hypothetical protein
LFQNLFNNFGKQFRRGAPLDILPSRRGVDHPTLTQVRPDKGTEAAGRRLLSKPRGPAAGTPFIWALVVASSQGNHIGAPIMANNLAMVDR